MTSLRMNVSTGEKVYDLQVQEAHDVLLWQVAILTLVSLEQHAHGLLDVVQHLLTLEFLNHGHGSILP